MEGDALRERHRPRGSHAGLWYDKFCRDIKRGADSAKRDWIDTVAGSVGTDAQINEYTLRLVRMIEAQRGGFAVFKTVSRFVTGLGRSHPVENGFAWHPTLGTPCLPGSSVKGMVRAWAEAETGSGGASGDIARLLGDRNRAGIISFLDAVPTTATTLDVDVMTPHYANWTADKPPGDWESPTPIPFLAVASGVTMLVGVIPRTAANANDVATVMGWVTQALEYQGAGAKTAVGYGRFEPDDNKRMELSRRLVRARERAEKERRRAEMSPVEREIEEVIRGRPGDAPSVVIYQSVNDGRWEGADRNEVAKWLKAAMERDGTWQTKKKKKKMYERTIAVMSWLGER